MEKINATVLIVDDDNDVLISAKLFLKNKISSILVSNHPTELNKLLSSEKIVLILLDMNYRVGSNDGKEGIYWLKHIKEIDSSIVVILMTAYGEIELAVEAIKAGAFDFILKPWANDKLYTTIKAGLTIKKPNEEKELKTAPLKNKNKEKCKTCKKNSLCN